MQHRGRYRISTKKGIDSVICVGSIFLLVLASSIAHAFPYKGLDIAIQGTVAEIYDDNVTFAKENKKEDFITRLGLSLDVKYEGRRRTLELIGDVTKEFHARFTDIDTSAESLSLDFQNEFSEHDNIRLKDTFIHFQAPGTLEEEFGLIRAREDTYRNRFNLKYIRHLTKKISLNAKYGNEIINFESPDFRDSYRNTVRVGINYKHSASTTYSTSYGFSNRSFKDKGDISTHSISAGMRRYITRRLYFDGKAGVTFTPSLTDEDTISYIINVLLTDEIDRRTTSTLSFIRHVRITTDREDIFRDWEISGSLDRELFKGLSTFLTVFYGEGTFVLRDITDRFLGASGRIRYAYSEHLAISLKYAYSNLDSSDEARNYTKNKTSLALIVRF